MENTILSGRALSCAWLGELCPVHVSKYAWPSRASWPQTRAELNRSRMGIASKTSVAYKVNLMCGNFT